MQISILPPLKKNDVTSRNQAVYHIQRYEETNEGMECLVTVRISYRGNDETGKLMYDFSCTNPDDMNYEALANRRLTGAGHHASDLVQ